MEDVKMFLFARWIATSYADEHLDENMKHSCDEGYDCGSAMSVLNRVNGTWWREKLNYFNAKVFPESLKNGSAANAEIFLAKIRK